MDILEFKYNAIIKNISIELINKLESSCCELINELIIMKNYEDSIGNANKYDWLHIQNTRDCDTNLKPIERVISRIFYKNNKISTIIFSVISKYFDNKDIDMVRRFADNYYICSFNCRPENCHNNWYHYNNKLDGPFQGEDSNIHSIIVFRAAMSFYMDLRPIFVKHQFLRAQETSAIQLK